MEALFLKVVQSTPAALVFFGLALFCLWRGIRYLYAARWLPLFEQWQAQEAEASSSLAPKRILTPNEQEFYRRLKLALPEFEVFPQVAMAAILQTTLDEKHPLYWQVRKLFSQKICDYVVCTPQLKLLAVVELDDQTHDTKKDKDAARDALLSQAGISTVRWDSRAKPDSGAIREKFSSYLPTV